MLRGTVIASRYKLHRKLGVGGMGQVWSARHTTTERKVAIKLILPNTDGAAVAKDRFLRVPRAGQQSREQGDKSTHATDYGRRPAPYSKRSGAPIAGARLVA